MKRIFSYITLLVILLFPISISARPISGGPIGLGVGGGGGTATQVNDALGDLYDTAAELTALFGTKQDLDAQLTALSLFTVSEISQLANIGATTISAAQWTGLGGATTAGIALWDDAAAVNQRTTLGLIIGTDVQAQDDELTDIAGLTFADDKIILGTGAGTIAMADCTAFAQSILDDADEATFKATVNLEAGTDFQAVVTEGSLTDSVIVSADIKNGTIASVDCVTALRIISQTSNALGDNGELVFTAGYDRVYVDLSVTVDDADIDIDEGGSEVDGALVIITNQAANTARFADEAGEVELAAPVILEQYETLTLQYATDRWVEVGRATNALGFSTITTTETEYIPISYMIDGASAPDALETITSDTDKVNVRTFQPAADEDVLFEWMMPEDIDASSGIKFSIVFYPTNATGPNSEVVQFELAGFSLGSGDALNGTLGSVQTSTLASSSHAQYDRIVTAWSAAMTSTHITDLSVDGETIIFKLNRDSGVGSDYEQLVGVSGIKLKYKRLHDATF